MQSISANLTAALLTIDATVTPRTLVDLYEFYASDYVPGVNGFDPADAIEKFASEVITWNGVAYRREVISRGDAIRNMGEKTNSATLTFSNISRYLATLAQSREIEGLFLVIRTVSPSVTDDSLVVFVGRCEKPSDIDKKTFTLAARQDFGNINQTLPPDKFVAEDPEGRLPSDPLFEGIPFVAVAGSNTFPSVVPTDSRIGRLLGRRRVIYTTQQWSSMDLTPYGSVIPEIFGRCQMSLIPFAGADKGLFLTYLMAASKGPIAGIDNIKTRTDGFSDPFNLPGNIPAVVHLGDAGGTGTNLGNTNQADLGGGLKFSHLAYIEGASTGSAADVTDGPPNVTAIVRGRKVPLPNSSGVYGTAAWSDNPVHIARFILTDPKFVNIDSAFMEDSVNYQTGLHCDAPVLDSTGSQIILVANPDLSLAGTGFTRYLSSGLYTPRYFLYNYLGGLLPSQLQDGPYIGRDGGDPVPDPSNPSDSTFLSQKPLIKRYTANFPVTEEVRAVDLLYKTIFPTAKLFLRVNKHGRYEIRSEKPSDSTRLRTATTVGTTSIPVLDVTPWKSGPDLLKGRIVLGFDIITSEVRTPSAAVYSTSGNSITLAASKTGTVTISASGSTLSGGSTTVQASGTITIGGSPASGNTVTSTINGIATVYILSIEDTTNTAAAMLAAYINANQRLNKYVVAVWDSASPTVITIRCLHGDLTVPELLIAHDTAIADPSSAPTCAGAAGGSLAAGTYLVAYADVNANGSTYLTASASVAVTASQKINLSSLPALVGSSRDFYISEKAGSQNLRLSVNRTDNADFSITAAPLNGAALPPSSNTTAEELLRIAMSFATNSQDLYPVWPASSLLILNDVYLPTVANGHKYKVTTAGTTGTTEPTWPTTAGSTVVSGGVTFTEFGTTILNQSGLTRANVKKDSLKWPLGSRQSSVNQIKGSYRDSKNDFALTPVRVNDPIHQAQVKKIYPLEFDASAIDNFNQFSRIANFLLSKNREGDWFISLATGPQGLVLEEGDLICVSDDSGGLINVVCRIEDLRIQPNHDVMIAQARRYSTLMFSDDVGSHRIPLPSNLRFAVTKDSMVEFVDNFPIRDADALTPGFYVAVSHDLAIDGDWRGWSLYADYGDGFGLIFAGDVPATIGTATSTIGTVTDPSVWDRVSSVTFTMNFSDTVNSPFATAPEQDILANARRNLFLVGDEYLQAATIVDNGNQSFTISTLLRGRFGTDSHQLTHGASERVIFLNGAEQFVGIDITRLNGSFNYKAVTVNQDLADAAVHSFTWTGGNLRPLSPINLRGTRDTVGSLLIQWTRRSRMSPGLTSGSDVPLAEESENYDVEILTSGNALKRTIPVVHGGAQAAVLVGSVHPESVDRNNLIAAAAPDNLSAAYSFQELKSSGSWMEATLVAPGSTSSTIGLIETRVKERLFRNLSDGEAYAVQVYFTQTQSAPGFFLPGINVMENGVLQYSSGSLGSVTSTRIRIQLSGTEIRYYWDYTGPGSVPFYITRVAPVFPLVAYAFVVGNTDPVVRNMFIGSTFDPSTIYSEQQQVEDFGSTQNPVRVRVYQISATVGRGDYAQQDL